MKSDQSFLESWDNFLEMDSVVCGTAYTPLPFRIQAAIFPQTWPHTLFEQKSL